MIVDHQIENQYQIQVFSIKQSKKYQIKIIHMNRHTVFSRLTLQ